MFSLLFIHVSVNLFLRGSSEFHSNRTFEVPIGREAQVEEVREAFEKRERQKGNGNGNGIPLKGPMNSRLKKDTKTRKNVEEQFRALL